MTTQKQQAIIDNPLNGVRLAAEREKQPMSNAVRVSRSAAAPKPRAWLGVALEFIGVSFAFVAAVFLVALGVWLAINGSFLAPIASVIAAFLLWSAVFRPIRDLGTRFRTPSIAEALLTDRRAPILYLRSFSGERRVAEEERALASMLDSIGPFVAIGRPGEVAPRLGAGRLYVADAEWQAAVGELLEKSSIVLMLAGRTAGLGYEIEECKRRIESRQLIIVIPEAPGAYDSFRRLFADRIGIELPLLPMSKTSWRRGLVTGALVSSGIVQHHSPGNVSGFVAFDGDWRPRLFPFVEEGTSSVEKVGWPHRMALQLGEALRFGGNGQLAWKLREPEGPAHVDLLPGVVQFGNALRALFVLGSGLLLLLAYLRG